SETLHANDISDQYVDLTARLSNARVFEERLLRIVWEKTGKLSELIEVESQLAREREQIEQLQGKQRLWDNQVALATVRISFRVAVAAAPAPIFGSRLVAALQTSMVNVEESAESLGL